MITNIHFKNFKALEDFSLTIKDFNVLTGPNNSGKSTILDGIRALQGAYRFASRHNPTIITLPSNERVYGYEIPRASIPIILENIQTNLDEDLSSTIKFKFSQEQTLTLLFHSEYLPLLYFETPRKSPKTATEFRLEFPVNISVVPTLGPFEIDEELVGQEYIQRWYGSRRSPRLFRSYWYYNSDNFDAFKDLVEASWKGMSISPPEKRGIFSKQLIMFCEEKRIPREICWAGFGFQIWLQLLTHILNAKDADLLVVDEPEIYLHPDLQHKILELLRNVKARTILATHSVEIINSVEPTEVLLIEKKNKVAKRISDLEGLQNVSNLLGSGQNIQLTRLARGKKILFVEGRDIKLLSKLSKICKREDLFSTGEITVIPIDGFSQYERIIHMNWGFSQILGEELKIAVLLDRDYRADEQVEIVLNKLNTEVKFAHILSKKEIENYFLVPSAIEKAVKQKLKERYEESAGILSEISVYKLLKNLTEKLRTETLAQLIAHKTKVFQKQGKDPSTIFINKSNEFDEDWKNLEYRLNAICGKAFFTILNDYLQSNFKISISYNQVANYISEKELDEDIKNFFLKLDDFRTNS